MDFAVMVHRSDTDPRRVASVPSQKFQYLGCPLRLAFSDAPVDVGCVGVIVHRQYLQVNTPPAEILRPVEQHVHCLSGLLQCQVVGLQVAATPGIDQMIETCPADLLLFQQVQNVRQIAEIVLVES